MVKNKRVIYRPKNIDCAYAANSIGKLCGYTALDNPKDGVQLGMVFLAWDDGTKSVAHSPLTNDYGLEAKTLDELIAALKAKEFSDTERLDWLDFHLNIYDLMAESPPRGAAYWSLRDAIDRKIGAK